MWLVATVGGIVAVLASPFPMTAKLLALIPLALALVMIALDEFLTARARIRSARAADTRLAVAYFDCLASLPDPEWAQVVPFQRRPDGIS